MMRSRRAIWAAGALFAAHEVLLHSPANALLEQGGLFGQDRVQEILLAPDSDRLRFIPTVSTLIYDKLGRNAAVPILEMVTSRHDRRAIGTLLDRLSPSTFQLLLHHVDDDRPGLTEGIRVIMNMVSVNDLDLQCRVIEILIKAGVVDRLVEEIAISVPARSLNQCTSLRQWLVKDPTEAIQFIREREASIRIFAKLLSNPIFSLRLRNDFDSCFNHSGKIRQVLGQGSDPGAALIASLSKAAIGAIGKRNAAKARNLYLAALPADDPQRRFLANAKSPVRGGAVLSFVTPHVADGDQITVERMKLAGSLGVISSVVSVVVGRRRGGLVRTLLWTGFGSSLFVLWNDLFINWDRFFNREVFPVFDRSTEQGRLQDRAWSCLTSCAHYLGNLGLFAAFPGSFLPYLFISSAHFTGELFCLSRLTGAAPPPHAPRIWIRPAPSGDA